MRQVSAAKMRIYPVRGHAGKLAQLLIGSILALSLAGARSEWRHRRVTWAKHGDPRDVGLDANAWTHTEGKTGEVSVTRLSASAVEILRNRGLPRLRDVKEVLLM